MPEIDTAERARRLAEPCTQLDISTLITPDSHGS